MAIGRARRSSCIAIFPGQPALRKGSVRIGEIVTSSITAGTAARVFSPSTDRRPNAMADPRVPETALRDAIDGIDELEFIDRGGQGDAWRLRRRGGGDEVLKVIVGADLARVRREVAVLSAIQDGNVMRFIETTSAQHGGATYPLIIGEYVAGGSVASRLQADDWPTEREALETVIGVLRGLAAIHAHEVVHRDIKPGNVALRDDRWSDPVIRLRLGPRPTRIIDHRLSQPARNSPLHGTGATQEGACGSPIRCLRRRSHAVSAPDQTASVHRGDRARNSYRGA